YGTQIRCTGGASITVTYSDIQGGWSGEGNIDDDPYFYDPANDDYSLTWNSADRSPCIDTGDPATDWDADNTPPDMGAIPAIPHDYDYRTLTVGDDINWISFPILDTRTTGYTAPEKALEEMGLKDPLILDQVLFENNYDPVIYYDDDGILHIDPEFEEFKSIAGYKIRLKEDAPNYTIGITGFRENPSTPIYLEVDKDNWIGYFLEYSQPALDAFSSIPWFSIKAKNWYLSHEYPKGRYTVNPGELYIVTVTANCNLVWGDGEPVPPDEKTQTEYFSYIERLDYMPIMCDTVYGDTTLIEIGVFDGNTCIGASVVEEYPVQILAYVEEDSTKDGGGELTFYLYFGGKNKSYKVNSVAVFDPVTSAFVDKPVYLDKDNFVIVRLNTEEAPEIPREFTLYQNYPNPVNNSTTICFFTTKNTKDTKIEIYNIKGQLVKCLECGESLSTKATESLYSISWDGKDKTGKFLASGIYFYKLISGNKSAIKKMVILR
ncbi:MAG: T9SS type A sorting domain-containing protein, partial [Candidatus Cloacimonetes bacterium]|nr:T9SS type A sorting domain-containing protein [Candidatus Cloacimonadota bacterium]